MHAYINNVEVRNCVGHGPLCQVTAAPDLVEIIKAVWKHHSGDKLAGMQPKGFLTAALALHLNYGNR